MYPRRKWRSLRLLWRATPAQGHPSPTAESLFGVVEVRAPRFGPCRCGVASRRTISPVAEIMPDRCIPEYERALAKMGAFLSYRRVRSLLEEFFPLGDAPEVETIRQRTLHVGARLEREAVAPPKFAPSTEPKRSRSHSPSTAAT